MKRVFILVSFICGITFSQPVFELPLLSDINVIPADSLNQVYYSFRLPINSFVFVKDGNAYSADYRIAVEVRDSSSKFFTRQIDENKIHAASFAETISVGTSEEGNFTFRLKDGTYFFTPILTDLNSNHEYRLRPLKVVCKKQSGQNFISPIVVNQNGNKLNGDYSLTNYAGDIPFSEDEYGLIIPSIDTSIQKINIVLINNKDTTSFYNVSKSFVSNLSVRSKDGAVILENGKGTLLTRNFLLSNFSRNLWEGKLTINLSTDDSSGIKKTFKNKVVWFNKPFSLRDPERAIKLLAVVDNSNTVDSLLSGSSKNYEHKLSFYWKRFDPTKNSAYNPLMAEYYTRVDYALKHFFTISRKREFLTDMSKVYIKYGKPVEIKRAYNQYGKSIETWFYKNPSNVFDFIDPEGTGNFMLVKKNE